MPRKTVQPPVYDKSRSRWRVTIPAGLNPEGKRVRSWHATREAARDYVAGLPTSRPSRSNRIEDSADHPPNASGRHLGRPDRSACLMTALVSTRVTNVSDARRKTVWQTVLAAGCVRVSFLGLEMPAGPVGTSGTATCMTMTGVPWLTFWRYPSLASTLNSVAGLWRFAPLSFQTVCLGAPRRFDTQPLTPDYSTCELSRGSEGHFFDFRINNP